jgi:hypothetical protein
MLHLTNGSGIIPKMREVGIEGRIVPWDDVLHEGPVPAGLNAAALRDVRAEFLATFVGDGRPLSRDDIARSLAARDAAVEDLGRAHAHVPRAQGDPFRVEEVVLWFEHDLFDQLHIIQILDRLPADGAPRVTAVPSDDYLGTQPAVRFTGLFAARTEITSAERSAARDAWGAFRSPDPRAIVDALPRVTALPHLAPALLRHLQQFPSIESGLSRTEQQAMEAVANGVSRVADLFRAVNHDREERIFMGDAAFVFHVNALVRSPRPLLRIVRADPHARAEAANYMSLDDEVALTDDGRSVLDGRSDRIALCGIDRWLGGVHLTGHGPVWRWDQQRQIVRTG